MTATPKPVVVFVPDLFGSHLRDRAGRVWIDDDALSAGGLSRLRFDAKDVSPDGVIAATYRTLVEALEKSYEVDAFDYDWRQPLVSVVEGVRDAAAGPLKAGRDVHLVGHGWGGVVAVTAANDPAIAGALRQRNARVIALGAPFGGSCEIRRILDGAHPLPKMLAAIGPPRTTADSVAEILASWPSLSECLPGRPPAVAAGVLPLLTTIAGSGVPTCVDATAATQESSSPLYRFHADGDGFVATKHALVPGARQIVLEASHAQLIGSAEAIRVCMEQLATDAPGPARAAVRPQEEQLEGREEPLPETITSVELIEASTGELGASMTLVYPLTVSVLHSHLRQAEYPLAIGHYRDDTIVSAEAALDNALGGRLSRRLDLDVYAGHAGAVEVLHVADAHPPGAIVVGLGDVGDLTPERLAKLVANAAVRHAVRVADASRVNGWQSAALSTLLIGTDSGSITLADSIRSIVRGVLEANRRLRATKLWDRVRIDRLQFVELFEDVAEQAAHVIASLPDRLAQELSRAEGINAVAQVAIRPGGEYSRPPEDFRAQGWWRRVQVSGRGSTQAAPGTVAALELVYTPLTDRAKLAQSTAVQSLPQVSRLVAASMTQPTVDLRLSNTLFELLVPQSLKNSIRNGGDLLLLLDSAAARYPFELMADRESTAAPVPLIKKCGILRQLELRDEPRKTDITSGRDVLVIGPPIAPAWPTLPGAREEAHRIADLCRDRGYRPNLVVDQSSRSVQTEIFGSDARVLHIAAHGQYSDNPLESGVVIGDDEYFTTANVAAMRRVPEFVFLNCCHLGRLGPDTKPSTAFPALAASLAEGFMSAGVRAVIASGWAIDDAAGLTFARTFYERFLNGELYGEAVRAARIETLTRHGHTSTWGAFQCYGSPEYRLRSTASAERKPFNKPPVSRGELIARLRSLAERAGGARGQEMANLVKEFDDQKKVILESARWQDGETLAALAGFAAQLEKFQDAIDLYGQALNVARGLAPLQAVEQLANMLGREAPRLAVSPDAKVAAGAIGLFDQAIGWLDWLDAKLKPPTAERYALRGSVHKRWAMLTRDKQRRTHLRDAWTAYGKARAQAQGDQSYQLLNWLALGFLLGKQRRQELLSLARGELARARANNAGSGDRSFWDRVALPDALLHVALFEDKVTEPRVFDEIEAAYGNAVATGPSARERASVRDHLLFLAEMLPDASLKLKLDTVPASELQRLIEQLH